MALYQEWWGAPENEVRPVPNVSKSFVCDYCLGPIDPEYFRWYGCHRLFGETAAPMDFTTRIVPMSVAVNPSLWYRRMLKYKRGMWKEYGAAVVQLASYFIEEHQGRFAVLLGGAPTALTVVPSKRGRPYDRIPLRFGLSITEPLGLARSMHSRTRRTLKRRAVA